MIDKITLTISNTIVASNVPPRVEEMIYSTFKIKNPLWDKLVAMQNTRALHGISRYFTYYVTHQNKDIELGRGAEPFLKQLGVMYQFPVEVVDNTTKISFPQELVAHGLVLRDYQQDVIEHINTNVGVIRLSPGYGKSIIALKLIEKLQQRTLIVVPRAHLVKQFQEEVKKYYGDIAVRMKPDTNISEAPIVITTIQTLQQMKKKKTLDAIKDSFGLVIADECHLYIPQKSRDVIQEFSSHYLYGLTGTADRTDGQGPAIFFTFGPAIVDRDMPTKAPTVKEFVVNSYTPEMEYSDMIALHIEDDFRNRDIARIANEESARGRKIVILTKRVAHVHNIAKYLNKQGLLVMLSSNVEENNEVFHRLKNSHEDFSVIIGTYALLGTGTDIPSLDTVIFAGDLRSPVLAEQAVGRVTRIFEDKEDPIVIDIHDKTNKILHRQFLVRKKLYREKGWDITGYLSPTQSQM